LLDWTAFVNLIKQYGPTIAALFVVIWWQWRHIDKLLERNAAIYESHIKSLYETQTRLLDKLLGPQPSSQTLPTMEQLKAVASNRAEAKEIPEVAGKE
jgi:hypothetical protein